MQTDHLHLQEVHGGVPVVVPVLHQQSELAVVAAEGAMSGMYHEASVCPHAGLTAHMGVVPVGAGYLRLELHTDRYIDR